MTYIMLGAGFILLLGGAEFLVRGSVSLARRLDISPMVIGMTVVALGTSAPEFVVSLQAAFDGVAGLATGNIIGSNIANIFLILGAAALIKPILIDPKAVTRDAIYLLAGTVIFVALCLRGELDLIAGVVLTTLFLAFLGASYWRETRCGGPEADLHAQEVEEFEGPKDLWMACLMTVGGIIAVLVGANFLVNSGTTLAREFGVSEEVIGLTMIAVGTSLPELAASAVAAIRGHSEVAIGNVLGSNLFNILGVMGVVTLIEPLPIGDQLMRFDLWVMLGATVILLPLMLSGKRLSRLEGGLFMAAYSAYILAQSFGVERLFQLI